MIKAVVFDFFGVVHADPYKRWLNAHGFKREGAFAQAADMSDKNLISWGEFFETLHELSGQPVADIKESFYQEKQIDPAVVGLIRSLKGNYKIGLLSNSNGVYLRPILEDNGIDDLFDVDIISAEVGIIKPDPAIFRLALDKLETNPEETVFIDDNSSNTESAATLGINTIRYRDLASLREELARLDVVSA